MDHPTVQPAPQDAPAADGEPLMEFGEVELRPLERKNEPSRDRSFASQVVGAVSPSDLPIYVDMAACEDIETHAREDTDNEVGGVLLGKQYEGRSGPYVLVVKALPAKHVEHSGTHLKFTHDTWETLSREKDTVAPDLDIVGWYHTHPGLTVFMSSYDRFIHDNFFNRPQDVALVVDPIANDRGFFHWDTGDGRKLRRCTGFHLVAPRHEKVALQQLSQALQTRPLSPLMGVMAEKEAEDMSRVTIRDLAIAVLVLLVAFQSLMIWNISSQRLMMRELAAAMPFTEGAWIEKNRDLDMKNQELMTRKQQLTKEVEDFKDKNQRLEKSNKDLKGKVSKLTESDKKLRGEVKDLQSRQKQLDEEIKRLGGKLPPKGLLGQTVSLPLAVGGAILLIAISSFITAMWMTRKHQQEPQVSEPQKPSA